VTIGELRERIGELEDRLGYGIDHWQVLVDDEYGNALTVFGMDSFTHEKRIVLGVEL
jgi:hypothetical protein